MEIARDPMLRFSPFYSHNGLIETLLGIGAIGVFLVAYQVVRSFVGVFSVLAFRPSAVDVLPVLVFFVSFILLNVTESTILAHDDLIWIIFVALAVRLTSLSGAAKTERNGL